MKSLNSIKKPPKAKKVKSEREEDGSAGSSKLPDTPDHIQDGQHGYMVKLRLLNPNLTCGLCEGYLIDAITIMDCLHSFCKSCLLMYFEDNKDCPKCHFVIHQSHPTHYVTYDRTLQEIVYKLVPGLLEAEQKRRKLFYEERKRLGIIDGEDEEESDHVLKKDEQEYENGVVPLKSNGICCEEAETHLAHNRAGDKDAVCLTPADDSPKLKHIIIALSPLATITSLKRLISYYLYDGDISHYNEFDIFCNDELMGRDYSVVFIRKTRLRQLDPDEPIHLVYKKHVEF
ncbi:unnamed protein product [Bursaphelenchus xylophilus]|uniref:(pine wood nematode) hypothetical protein n=1 Tax=Bursaphelenchus xylophilus TaxID=6326 RepID=A0A1I7SE20_BURXY|nr:unnamed protein product [Bursaphelenchus xylophilus]CAG9113165.1 unnamed protein product [Bursaphelenchus xylophilus]